MNRVDLDFCLQYIESPECPQALVVSILTSPPSQTSCQELKATLNPPPLHLLSIKSLTTRTDGSCWLTEFSCSVSITRRTTHLPSLTGTVYKDGLTSFFFFFLLNPASFRKALVNFCIPAHIWVKMNTSRLNQFSFQVCVSGSFGITEWITSENIPSFLVWTFLFHISTNQTLHSIFDSAECLKKINWYLKLWRLN